MTTLTKEYIYKNPIELTQQFRQGLADKKCNFQFKKDNDGE